MMHKSILRQVPLPLPPGPAATRREAIIDALSPLGELGQGVGGGEGAIYFWARLPPGTGVYITCEGARCCPQPCQCPLPHLGACPWLPAGALPASCSSLTHSPWS